MKILLSLFLLLTPVLGQEPMIDEKTAESIANIAEKLFGKNGGNRLFYFPTKTAPDTPKTHGQAYEDVSFKSQDGTKLHGWFMNPAKGVKVKGTIVYSHGNAGSVGYHLPFVLWMIENGYQVLLYDYRGFGKSEGTIERKGLVEDVHAAFDYVKTRKDVDAKRLISFGHSLGGAKSLAALGQKMIPGVRGVVSFAGFASYQDMARHFAGDMGVKLVSDDLSARDLVEKIAPIPVLIIHGTADGTVPFSQGELLFKKAKEPKTFFKIKEGNHAQALSMNNQEYRKKILEWLAKVLA